MLALGSVIDSRSSHSLSVAFCILFSIKPGFLFAKCVKLCFCRVARSSSPYCSALRKSSLSWLDNSFSLALSSFKSFRLASLVSTAASNFAAFARATSKLLCRFLTYIKPPPAPASSISIIAILSEPNIPLFILITFPMSWVLLYRQQPVLDLTAILLQYALYQVRRYHLLEKY